MSRVVCRWRCAGASGQPLVLLFAVLAVGSIIGAGSIRGVSIGPAGALFAGLYAGSLTNTPSPAAAKALVDPAERSLPVVGYALAYPFGVLGLLAAIVIIGRFVPDRPDAAHGTELQSVTIRVGTGRGQSVEDLYQRHDDALRVSRVQRSDRMFVPVRGSAWREHPAGLVSGAHTQPAALAFAAERTGDPQLDLTDALVLPAAMDTKILVAQLLILL